MEHQPFSVEIPLPCYVDEDEGDETYMRDNVEGFWVDQNVVQAEE
jgi:hypothetical protein